VKVTKDQVPRLLPFEHYVLNETNALPILQLARYKDQEILLATMVTAFGTFGFAMYPISMELAVEITYPVAEATSSGLLVVSGYVDPEFLVYDSVRFWCYMIIFSLISTYGR
jgi:hypothetical protein